MTSFHSMSGASLGSYNELESAAPEGIGVKD